MKRVGWLFVCCVLFSCGLACQGPLRGDGEKETVLELEGGVGRAEGLLEGRLEEGMEEKGGEESGVEGVPEGGIQPEPSVQPERVVEVQPEPKPTTLAPFVPQVDDSEGLINISLDLKALLEQGQLKDACDRWKKTPTDRKAMLMCGKYMFFYESFGTSGIPKAVVKGLLKHFGEAVGKGFEGYGLIADPLSAEGMPLGMADSAKLNGSVETVALTCASCHFGRLPDGRYAVGAPNHEYQYGQHMLAVALFPSVVSGQKRGDMLDPVVQQAMMPLLRLMWDQPLKRVGMSLELAGIAFSGLQIPTFTDASQKNYAMWPSGTMDFLIDPLLVDDKVHTVSKINALWGIPREAEQQKAGMKNAMLGWTGGTVSLVRFAEDFVLFGGGKVADWPRDRLMPLAEYIYTLRAPAPTTPPVAEQVSKGQALFVSKGCLGCHDGPRGSGKRVYTFGEIGTDDAMKKWMDPDLDGVPCCDIRFPAGESLTHGIKSPRLVGLWAAKRFLHNGSLSSLESLFCLDGPRPASLGDAMDTRGHTMTCDGLSEEEKRSLIAFLRSL